MINSKDVIDKFWKITKLYGHSQGHMIFTIHNVDFDISSIPLQWDTQYLPVSRANVYCAYLKVTVFKKELIIPIYKPTEPVHLVEFEDFFNFGPNCSEYDPNRITAVLPLSRNTDFNIDEILQTDNIDYEYCQETIKLLCLGGFIKYWKGVNTFTEWFKSEANIELNSSNTFKLLLNNFVPIIKIE